MFVTAKITAEMPEAWVLPATAVVKQADQTVVFLHVDGKAARLTVQPGRTDGTWTEVFRKQKAGGWEEWSGVESVLNGGDRSVGGWDGGRSAIAAIETSAMTESPHSARPTSTRLSGLGSFIRRLRESSDELMLRRVGKALQFGTFMSTRSKYGRCRSARSNRSSIRTCELGTTFACHTLPAPFTWTFTGFV